MQIALLADGSEERFVFDKAVEGLSAAEKRLTQHQEGLSIYEVRRWERLRGVWRDDLRFYLFGFSCFACVE